MENSSAEIKDQLTGIKELKQYEKLIKTQGYTRNVNFRKRYY